MRIQDGDITYYQLVARTPTYNDHEWFCYSLDILRALAYQKWNTHSEVIKNSKMPEKYQKALSESTASGQCWQEQGEFGWYEKKDAMNFLKMARKVTTETKYEFAIRKIHIRKESKILS